MIKVLYSGYIVRDMYNNHHASSTVGKAPEYVKEHFCLCDDDIETLNDFGSVKIRSVIGERLDEYDMLIYENGDDLPFVKYSGFFTDSQGNETPFKIIKGENTYSQDNGNQLKIFFDDDAPQTNIENSINPSTDDLEQNYSLPTNEKLATKDSRKKQERDEDFKLWVSIDNPPLAEMIKEEIHNVLKARDSKLWTKGFADWWKRQTIYKAPKGRKKRLTSKYLHNKAKQSSNHQT
jgi:hypothetical protein